MLVCPLSAQAARIAKGDIYYPHHAKASAFIGVQFIFPRLNAKNIVALTGVPIRKLSRDNIFVLQSER